MSGNDIRITATVRTPLSPAAAERLARAILKAEKRPGGTLSIAFVGSTAIRRLNREHLGRDALTDVIAFSLTPDTRHPTPVVGDVYVCPQVAVKNARAAGVTARDELRRLVVHGVLHVLGYDHPDGARRMRSPMWRRQERYLARFSS